VRRRVRFDALLAVALMAGLATTFTALPLAAQSDSEPTDPFAAVDESMRERVRIDGLAGGVVLVARDGGVIHETSVRDVDPATVLPVASASKWLTAATLMTLVDEGKLSLDAAVATYLPEFTGAKRKVRVRNLLAHTSGLPWHMCLAEADITTENCVDAIAGGPDPVSKPGTAFQYTSVGYEVAGRIIEVLTGQTFEDAFQARIAVPLGMTSTRFDEIGGQQVRHPQPAASAVSSVDDYARFLRMLNAGGVAGGRRVLSAASIAEIERNQVTGVDTLGDGAVHTTGIPTYGLGVWRDVIGPADETRVISGNGAYGFYPWIDRRHNAYGIIGVADLYNGAEHAVPASQRQARRSWRIAARWVP
jgi:CubicO group peptidase (beta-lactamase class C family)